MIGSDEARLSFLAATHIIPGPMTEPNAAARSTPSLVVVQHWFDQLRQLVPER